MATDKLAGNAADKGPEKKGIVQEFKAFALRGNVLDLAVAVVMGAAFNDMVKSFAEDFIMPLITSVFRYNGIENMKIILNGSEVKYGAFIAAIIHFLLVAFALFILIKAINQFRKKQQEDDDAKAAADEAAKLAEEEAAKAEVALLTEIRDLLKEKKE